MVKYARESYDEVQIISDAGSGLNERRESFLKLLEMFSKKKVSKVIVAYENRVTRFGFEILKKLLSALGTEIEIINHEEKTPHEEFVEDLIMIVSHFAWKLYGMRSNKHKEVVEDAKKLFSKHDQQGKLFPLIIAYRNLLNSIIDDIWNLIEWKENSINGKKQIRIIPYYEKSRELRNKQTSILKIGPLLLIG